MITSSKALSAAVAGIVASVVFTASALVQSLLRDDHALLADPVSALAAGPDGWVQNVAFTVTGVLMILFAAGVHLAVRAGRNAVFGPVFIALFGVGLLGAAAFPAADATGPFVAEQVPAAHSVSAVVAFLSAGLGALLVSWRLADDERWRDLCGYTRAVGVTILALFIGGGVLVRPMQAPFHDWLGLWQWILVVLWFSCVIVLAVRLLRTSSHTAAAERRSVQTGIRSGEPS